MKILRAGIGTNLPLIHLASVLEAADYPPQLTTSYDVRDSCQLGSFSESWLEEYSAALSPEIVL